MFKDKTLLITGGTGSGLGYVGMPIAVSFSGKANVIGFDVN